MSKTTATQPTQPNPTKVAAQQSQSNLSTAIENAIIGNANTVGPNSSTTFSQTGTTSYTDPATGTTYEIPQYTSTQTLNPNLQSALDSMQGGAAQLAKTVDTSAFNAPQDASSYTAAIMSRAQPALDLARKQLDTQLQGQGYVPGTDAYNQAMKIYGQQYNDEVNQALLTGQKYQGQELQQQIAARMAPIQQISAMEGAVSVPGATAYNAPTVQSTPIGDYYMTNEQTAEQAYQAQLSAQSQEKSGLYSGIGNLVGAGLYGLGKASDRRVKFDIRRIGTWFNGLPVYLFRYIADPLVQHIGFMADEVEKIAPHAVVEINGIKHVYYALAMRA